MKDKHSDRDDAVDRLLAGTLKARAEAVPDAVCLDTETLAAWADGALDARERWSAEAHAADCGRCQALLAAMVKTMPPPSVAASPLRTRSLWWLAATAPVAAALVVWFAVPARTPVQQSQSAAVVDQAAPDTPAEARAKVAAASSPQSTLAKEKDSASANALSAAAEAVAVPAAPPPPASVGGVAAAPPASIADSRLRQEAGSAPERYAAFARVESVIVSSNPATRFRLLPGGGVQRSADGGAIWRTEVTGATETLTAGASPSPSVCWLIGRSGMVLLSTDGRSWRRVVFPEAVDLQSVSAADAENATVTTVDGRAFVTTDGGQTWSRAPNP